jgi:hypothetical protein
MAEPHIFSDRQIRNEIKLLVDDGDTATQRIERRPELTWPAVDVEGAAVGTVDSTEDLEEGALTRPVLPAKPVDRGRPNVERNVLKGLYAGKALRDRVKAQQIS